MKRLESLIAPGAAGAKTTKQLEAIKLWRLFFKRFGARVVMTVDFDGEIRIRFAKNTPIGFVTKKVWGKVLLKPDGTTDTYIEKWVEL